MAEQTLEDILDHGLDLEDPKNKNLQDPTKDKSSDKDAKTVALEKTVKDLSEKIRQMSESNKGLDELHKLKDRLFGDPEKENLTKQELEYRNRYDDDPLTVIKEIFGDMITPLKNDIALNNTKTVLNRAMQNIDINFEVDWDKDYPKILEEINGFSKEARIKNPEGTLLKACKLAGVAKKRETPLTSLPNLIQFSSGQAQTAKIKKEEADKIRDRITSRLNKSKNKEGKSAFLGF